MMSVCCSKFPENIFQALVFTLKGNDIQVFRNGYLKDLFAYLKTVKPVDHYVDNTQDATDCARCGLSHGGGARNKKTT